MQTYLPYPSLVDSVATYERFATAGSRRTILRVLDALHQVEGTPDLNGHPEVERWRGYEPFLCQYGFELDTHFMKMADFHGPVKQDFERRITWHLQNATSGEYTMLPPPWWGDEKFHLAEKSALLRLVPEHYLNHFEGIAFDVPPVWPTHG